MFHLFSTTTRFSYITAMVVVLGLSLCSLRPARKSAPYCVDILQGSKLYLKGSSNVNNFSCDCESLEKLPPLQLGMELDHQQNQALFESASLRIKTNTLDCGHRGINRDLYESLRAEQHPYIGIELEEAHLPKDAAFRGGKEWVSVWACTKLTVAGVSRKVDMKVKVKKVGYKTYRFLSSHHIKMTDYRVQPPSVMFGAIKVNDEIEINFDLLVESE